MFCCIFEEYFGIGETCIDAYYQLIENVEAAGGDTYIEPDSCDFYVQVSVDVTTKTEYHIEPDLDSI